MKQFLIVFLWVSIAQAQSNNTTDCHNIYYLQLIPNTKGAAIAGSLYLGAGITLAIPAIVTAAKFKTIWNTQTDPTVQGLLRDSPVSVAAGMLVGLATTVSAAAFIQSLINYVNAAWSYIINPREVTPVQFR